MATITVFGASAPLPGEPEYDDGVLLGSLLAERGHTVVTGGYGGIMEAVSAGAASHGGHVIGVTAPPVFPSRTEGANSHVTEELRADSLMERIHELTNVADAAVAMPGSIGTLTELMAAWNIAFVARFAETAPKPLIAVGGTWRRLVDTIASELRTDVSLVTLASDVRAAVQLLDNALGS